MLDEEYPLKILIDYFVHLINLVLVFLDLKLVVIHHKYVQIDNNQLEIQLPIEHYLLLYEDQYIPVLFHEFLILEENIFISILKIFILPDCSRRTMNEWTRSIV